MYEHNHLKVRQIYDDKKSNESLYKERECVMILQYLGIPETEKENYIYYKCRFQKSLREGSKCFYEVHFSVHKDCSAIEIWEEFNKEFEKKKRKTKQPVYSYFYKHIDNGFWNNVSIYASPSELLIL